MGIFLVLAVLAFGILYLRLITLPARIMHRTRKLQFEIVATLGLIALFTQMHIFWVAGLLLALIDFPDFGGFLSRIAGSAEKIAGAEPAEEVGLGGPPIARGGHDRDARSSRPLDASLPVRPTLERLRPASGDNR